MKIGKINIDRGLLLAPMEGVTDISFRLMCKRMGADIVYSEFVASEAIIRDVQKSLNKMKIIEEERPAAIQIFGSRDDAMIESAKIAESFRSDFLDINFGCWVKKVVNNNSGAAFLKNPKLMGEMAKCVVKAVTTPVTAKTRLGWDSNSINILEVSKILEDSGVAAITIHCRTREMGMGGLADWSWIKKVKDTVRIPVILNGDIKTPEDSLRAFETTGCDAVMIGRAAVGNPFLFRRTKALLITGITPPEPDIDERINACLEHLHLNIELKGYPRGLFEFRKHYSGYLKGIRNASALRQRLVLMDSFDEIQSTLYEFAEQFKD
jgi:tRNA-dihydrouridine synthase B